MRQFATGKQCDGECHKTIDGLYYSCPKCGVNYCYTCAYCSRWKRPKMRSQPNIINPALGRRDSAGIVRIRRAVKERRYLGGKSIYKHQQLELTIPAKFKDIVEPFMHTDLKIEARREGNNLLIEAKPMPENV